VSTRRASRIFDPGLIGIEIAVGNVLFDGSIEQERLLLVEIAFPVGSRTETYLHTTVDISPDPD